MTSTDGRTASHAGGPTRVVAAVEYSRSACNSRSAEILIVRLSEVSAILSQFLRVFLSPAAAMRSKIGSKWKKNEIEKVRKSADFITSTRASSHKRILNS